MDQAFDRLWRRILRRSQRSFTGQGCAGEESRLFAVEVARRMIRSDLAALVLAFVAVAIIGHLL